VLCSGFNNAPSSDTQLLLARAREVGVRSLPTHVALLVLPRTGEALAAKDESGIRVERVDEGYELKGEQVALALQPLGLDSLATGFYNAHQDSADRLQSFLIERLTILRSTMRDRLRAILSNARSVLDNYEREQVQEVVRQAERMLRTWIQQNAQPCPLSAHVQDSLMEQLARAYASTIRATIRREGEWPNLSYSHHLGYGARRIAVLSLEQRITRFGELCETMRGTPDYAEARDLISQAERILTASYEELLRKVQLMGQTSFREELRQDMLFWVECNSEWGQGPGYRHRVSSRNVQWFGAEPRQELERELLSLISREWEGALSSINALFEAE
jgi:hypothetical protein